MATPAEIAQAIKTFQAELDATAPALARVIEGAMTVTHLQTGSSEVRCGAKMAHWKDNPKGWDLGTVTTDPTKVTCPRCRGKLA